MCNYSEFLRQEGKEEGRQEGKEEGRQEGKEKEKLEVLEQLQLLHFSDKKIMTRNSPKLVNNHRFPLLLLY